MDRKLPDQLNANRVYFTELDRTTYSQVAWTKDDIEQIVRSLERKIKLLALTKGHIVIAASHLLESELARELILPYPELFAEGIVVPALRDDYASCAAFLDAKQRADAVGERELYQGDEQEEMAQIIDSTAMSVRWNPAETSGWFKMRLISDLRDDNSLVSIHLRAKGLTIPEAFFQDLDGESSLSRRTIYHATQRHGNLLFRDIVNTYADFLYYLSGAKAVQSEGVLPQENIVDFNFTELEHQTVSLSDHEVFFKVFMDTVKAATSTHFPADFLDALTIDDAVYLHRVASEEQFIRKYNLIQQRTKDGLTISDPERLILLMEELLEYERELHKQFSSAIDAELPNRLRQIRSNQKAQLIHSLASLIVVPYGVICGIKDVVVSGLSVVNADGLKTRVDDRIRKGVHALEWCVGEKFENQPVMLRFVDEMKRRYVEKMMID